MEIDGIYGFKLPILASSFVDPASLPQSEDDTARRKLEDDAPVRLNLSQAARNLLSSSGDVAGGSTPVQESERQERNPNSDPEEQSRQHEDASKEPRR